MLCGIVSISIGGVGAVALFERPWTAAVLIIIPNDRNVDIRAITLKPTAI